MGNPIHIFIAIFVAVSFLPVIISYRQQSRAVQQQVEREVEDPKQQRKPRQQAQQGLLRDADVNWSKGSSPGKQRQQQGQGGAAAASEASVQLTIEEVRATPLGHMPGHAIRKACRLLLDDLHVSAAQLHRAVLFAVEPTLAARGVDTALKAVLTELLAGGGKQELSHDDASAALRVGLLCAEKLTAAGHGPLQRRQQQRSDAWDAEKQGKFLRPGLSENAGWRARSNALQKAAYGAILNSTFDRFSSDFRLILVHFDAQEPHGSPEPTVLRRMLTQTWT